MNSAASLKAFCGKNGGIVCTSSNAAEGVRLGLRARREAPLLPRPAPRPQHRPQEGHPARRDGRLGLHAALRLARRQHPRAARAREGHPLEGPLLGAPALLGRADREGARRSTRASRSSSTPSARWRSCRPPTWTARPSSSRARSRRRRAGSKWAVGTEINLVSRLARENPDKTVFCLDPVVCPCATMYRIHPAYLAWALDELADGRVVNQVTRGRRDRAVRPKVALERMLAVR